MKNISILFYTILCVFCLQMSSCSDSNTITGCETEIELDEGTLLLGQNYPNPFNPTTCIRYHIPKNMYVKMRVYTEDWQEVSTLMLKEQWAGYYSVQFNGKNGKGDPLPSGEYYYTLEADGHVLIRMMKLAK